MTAATEMTKLYGRRRNRTRLPRRQETTVPDRQQFWKATVRSIGSPGKAAFKQQHRKGSVSGWRQRCTSRTLAGSNRHRSRCTGLSSIPRRRRWKGSGDVRQDASRGRPSSMYRPRQHPRTSAVSDDGARQAAVPGGGDEIDWRS
jgi:hypothetical protein